MTFDLSKTKIGSMMQLQPDGPGAPKYTVHLVGMLKNKGVCVTQPMLGGEMAMVRDNQKVMVRFFSGKDAVAFETTALKQTITPYPMLHLAYPKSVMVHRVRGRARLQLDLIAVALAPERGVQISLKISDLSVGGASLMTPAVLGDVGDTVMLKFKVTVEGVEVLFELTAVIRNIVEPKPPEEDKEKDDGRERLIRNIHKHKEELPERTYGVSFQDIPEDRLIALVAYVSNCALEQL